MSPLFVMSLCCVFILINAKVFNSQKLESNFDSRVIQTRGGGGTCADNPARECSVKICQSIQQRIDTYKVNAPGCKGTDAKPILKDKMVKIQKLLDARLEIKRVCFKKDTENEGGHPGEINKCEDMLKECQRFIRASAAAGRCYQCNSNNPRCGQQIDPSKKPDTTPCNGQCYTSIVKNTVYRGCSWEHGFMKEQVTEITVEEKNRLWSFCDTALCNSDANSITDGIYH
ncbi:unnamed protein product [Adineta steineri]|uniref:Uncharacterized protein n=1 Tax=Adineta steineri TaxID=433720 RepID=A0A813W7V2_9BILA|nr:unnamed protein product [Adineta steineri]